MSATASSLRTTVTLTDPDGILRDVDYNPMESPLAWLFTRTDKSGNPLIAAEEFMAGERLRHDYTLAGLIARTTMNWDGLGGRAERRREGGGLELNAVALDARNRVNAAIKAIGPDLAGVAVDVCCHLAGLADVERIHGWPQRSGKVVLRLALAALARHYGLEAEARGGGRAPMRQWDDAGLKPTR